MGDSEPEEANSALRRSLRLIVFKLRILNDVSAHKIFLPKNETAGFTVGKRQFLDVSEFEEAYSVLRQSLRLPVCNFERRFGNLRNFPTGKLNGRDPLREVTIFLGFGA